MFRSKTNLTIEDIASPEGFVIVTKEIAWMDEILMFTLPEKVCQTYAKKTKRTGL